MADVKKLAEELVNLTVKEVNELATILKEEYGIEPAAAAVAVAAPAAAAGEAAAAEKSAFDVILKNAGLVLTLIGMSRLVMTLRTLHGI
jgi:large subunit ribosomal protein L7/L12